MFGKKNIALNGFTLLEMFLALSLLLILASSAFLTFTTFTKRLNIQYSLLTAQGKVITILKLLANDIKTSTSPESLYEIKPTSRTMPNGQVIYGLYRKVNGFSEEVAEGVSRLSFSHDKRGIKVSMTIQLLNYNIKDQHIFYYFNV